MEPFGAVLVVLVMVAALVCFFMAGWYLGRADGHLAGYAEGYLGRDSQASDPFDDEDDDDWDDEDEDWGSNDDFWEPTEAAKEESASA